MAKTKYKLNNIDLEDLYQPFIEDVGIDVSNRVNLNDYRYKTTSTNLFLKGSGENSRWGKNISIYKKYFKNNSPIPLALKSSCPFLNDNKNILSTHTGTSFQSDLTIRIEHNKISKIDNNTTTIIKEFNSTAPVILVKGAAKGGRGRPGEEGITTLGVYRGGAGGGGGASFICELDMQAINTGGYADFIISTNGDIKFQYKTEYTSHSFLFSHGNDATTANTGGTGGTCSSVFSNRIWSFLCKDGENGAKGVIEDIDSDDNHLQTTVLQGNASSDIAGSTSNLGDIYPIKLGDLAGGQAGSAGTDFPNPSTTGKLVKGISGSGGGSSGLAQGCRGGGIQYRNREIVITSGLEGGLGAGAGGGAGAAIGTKNSKGDFVLSDACTSPTQNLYYGLIIYVPESYK